MKITTLLLAMLVASALLCAAPLATVNSAQPFLLEGKAVTTAGVSNWPVFQGSKVDTREASALLTFKDGSMVLLAKQTQAVVLEKDGKAALKLIKGEASFKFSQTGGVVLEGVEKATAKVGVLRVSPDGSVMTAEDAGYFAWVARSSTAYQDRIDLTYGALPTGVTASGGPAVSVYFKP